MKRATLITGGVVLALALAAGGGFAYSAANSRTSVGTAEVTKETLSVTVSASGTVDAANSGGVFPAVAGTLATVVVKDGDQVAKGATIATLDAGPLELAVAQAKSALTSAKAAVTAAQAQREIVEDKFSLNREKQAAREAVAAAEQAVTVAERVLARAKSDLAGVEVVAPLAGVVTVPETTQPGLGVSPAVAIATIVDQAELEFVAAVDESDIALLEAGQSATVTLDAYPNTPLTGTTTSLRTTPETTATGGIAFPVRISFDAAGNRLLVGMNGSADLEVKSIADALTVPIEAVLTDGDQRYVFTVDTEGIAHRRAVIVGPETDTRAQVVDGLNAGDRVVTTGATTLSDGQKVQA